MDKKKLFSICILAIGIISVIVVAVIMLNKNTPTPIIKSKPLNARVNLEQVFQAISEENQSEEQAKGADELEFNQYEVLEKKAIINTNDESVDEVWMIKLGSYEQQEDVCRILGTRVQKLKGAFENNIAQMKIVNSAIIKQEDGIVIMIISPDAKEIEEKIAQAMAE